MTQLSKSDAKCEYTKNVSGFLIKTFKILEVLQT